MLPNLTELVKSSSDPFIRDVLFASPPPTVAAAAAAKGRSRSSTQVNASVMTGTVILRVLMFAYLVL